MTKTDDSFNTFYKFKKVNEKETVVFVHGVGLTHEIWDQQIEYFKNYNTVVYDLIGHGETPFNKIKITMEDFNKQLLSLFDNLNLKKIHLVGFSLGSLIARDFASKNSSLLNSLVIFGTIYKRTEDQKRQIINRYEMMKKNKELSKKRALNRWFTEGFIKKNPLTYKKIYSMLEKTNNEIWLKVYKLFIYHEDNDMNIKQITTNSLIITGENDIGSKPEMSKNLSKIIKNSTFKTIKNGKHLCNIECSKIFNITIREFIDNNA